MHPNYSGPYSVAGLPSGDGKVKPHRHNDGALIVMGLDCEGEPAPVLHIPMRAHAKPGHAWHTIDPEQEAFAAALVSLLNAAAREPFANEGGR